MRYQYIDPEVAGGLGDETIMDNSVHPPIIYKLNYKFDGWLNNDIVESFPCFIVTERLMVFIKENDYSGILFDEVKVTISEQFMDVYPNKKLPKFCWMKVTGNPGKDDFGISKDYRLVLSQKVIENLVHYFNISEADFEEY